MRIVLAGGSGFCGRLLHDFLKGEGHDTTVLSRSPRPGALLWDGATMGPWAAALDGADALINLAGRTVNCRYHADHCMEIYASRLDSTRVLGEAITACATSPKVWLNAASATIYRHALDRPMDEATGELGKGFSVDVCRRWERTLFDAATPGTRRVALRSAMVMNRGEGGPYEAYAGLVRAGLGGPMAGGAQFVSWVHGVDFCRAIAFLLEREDLDGPVNIAAPEPLPNREFMAILRRSLHRPFGLPSPRPLLELGAWLRGTETELILKSRRVVPGKLLAAGFTFTYPTWTQAATRLARP